MNSNREESFNSLNSIENNSSLITNINPSIALLSFHVRFETKYGQSVFIVGNIEELGSWEPSKAIPMTTCRETYPIWKITTELVCPLGMEIYYKYLVKEGNNIYWEEINNSKSANRHIIVQSPGKLIINDEKSNTISKIKSIGNINSNLMSPFMTDNNSIKNILLNIPSNPISNSNTNTNKNNIVTGNFFTSYQSLSSSFQKDSDLSLVKFEEGGGGYFNNLSDTEKLSKDICDNTDKTKTNDNLNEENIHLDMINLNTNLKEDDKILIVTTFLPFIIEKKDTNDNSQLSDSNSFVFTSKYKLTLYDDKLINLILYSLKTINFCEVYWVGILRGLEEYPEKTQFEVSEYLENQKIFVVTPQKKDLINFQIYLNKILYPAYNSNEIDIESHFYQNQDVYYAGYLNVNKNFADVIYSYSDNDDSRLIFINDIDLAFIPNYLLQKNINANICLYLHTNFPSYETISLMTTNKEILKSLLLCNSIGFHSFKQAMNFLEVIRNYFFMTYKVKYDGLFFVEYLKREISIFVKECHIEIDFMRSFLKGVDNQKISNESDKLNILSVDLITNNIEDILTKLDLFLDINIDKFKGFKFNCTMVLIKEKYKNKYLTEEDEKYEKIIKNKIKELKEKIGSTNESLIKIVYVDFFSVSDQIKYLKNANIFLYTDINLYNCMRTLCQEFLFIKNDSLSSEESKNKKNGIIVKENLLIPEEIKSVIKINNNSIEIYKNALAEIIKMNNDERIKILNNDINKIKKYLTRNWVQDFLCELKKLMINNKNIARVKLGIGFDFSYYQISNNLKLLQLKKLAMKYQNSTYRLFFIDINTIINNINIEEENSSPANLNSSNSYLDNNKKIIELLTKLSNDPNNIVYLLTHHSKEIFKHLHNLDISKFGCVAEGGLVIKYLGEENFTNMITSNNWKLHLIKLFNNFCKKTGMGKVSQKENSVLWNYKNNDLNSGYMLGEELENLVFNFLEKCKYDIVLNNNSLEVTLKNDSKYLFTSTIIQNIINEGKDLNFIFSLNNNDKRGEEFMTRLINIENQFINASKSINLFTVVIGKKLTKARYYLRDTSEICEVFKFLDMKQ